MLTNFQGRKFLQEHSSAYMTARSAYTELQNTTQGLERRTLPVLPPGFGFQGDIEYKTQVHLWEKWIRWERENPIVLKDEKGGAGYRSRVLYVYKQALMALRFWPPMWHDAAEFCFSNAMDAEGADFLSQGLAANPESCLLALKQADHIELTTSHDETEESIKRRGDAVKAPYEKVLDALYDLVSQLKYREEKALSRLDQAFQDADTVKPFETGDGDEDDAAEGNEKSAAQTARQAQIEAVKKSNAAQLALLSRTISFVWIALMRAMRRIQGKGKVGEAVGGSRQIFTDARKRGRLTSDVYIAAALIEYHCYKDPAATKIFERGLKLFPEDEIFALEYMKHLLAINDITSMWAISIYASKLTNGRCARRVRDHSQPAGTKARKPATDQRALCILPSIRISVRRA